MTLKIFMIAGEPSGDSLGAGLMQALKTQTPDIEFTGIGGPQMEAQGMDSLLLMSELCVMGLWEVVWQLDRLNRMIHGVVTEIEKVQPDVVITIDLPDFNFQVGQRLKKRGQYKGKLIHYAAPTVWAWRPGRAKKIAAFLDGLMCLYPFEPEHFTKHGLKTEFVGHPLVESDLKNGDGSAFKDSRGIPEDAPVMGLFFGSRESELKAMSRILIETTGILHEQSPDLHVVIPTLPHLELDILKLAGELPCPSFVVPDPKNKWDAFAACDTAMAVSGTIGLELAYAGIPHVIVYKMHPVSWAILQRMVRVKNAHLANIILDGDIVPEFLQSKCRPLTIAKGMLKLFQDKESRDAQTQQLRKIRDMLGENQSEIPSAKAAQFVMATIGA